jgi:hypothetical protein
MRCPQSGALQVLCRDDQGLRPGVRGFYTASGRHHRRKAAGIDPRGAGTGTHVAFAENASSVKTPYRARPKTSTEHPRPDLNRAGRFDLAGQLCLLVELAKSGVELIYLVGLTDVQFGSSLILISEAINDKRPFPRTRARRFGGAVQGQRRGPV